MIDNRDLRLINIKREDELIARHVILIRLWQSGMGAKKIAKKLGIPAETVQSRVDYLRREGVPLYRRTLRFLPLKQLIAAAKKYPARNRSQNMDENFIRLWQQAKTAPEAAKAAGISLDKAKALAWYWRKRGVPLKKFRSWKWDIDADKMKEIAFASLRPMKR